MNDNDLKKTESLLAELKPSAASDLLRGKISDELSHVEPVSTSVSTWQPWLWAAGLATAVALAGVAIWSIFTPPQLIPSHEQPAPMVEVDELTNENTAGDPHDSPPITLAMHPLAMDDIVSDQPTLWAYRLTASVGTDELDSLLDEHAQRVLPAGNSPPVSALSGL